MIADLPSIANDLQYAQTDAAVQRGRAQAAMEAHPLHQKRDEMIAPGNGVYDKRDGCILYRDGLIASTNERITYNVMEFAGWAKITIWKIDGGSAQDILVDERGTAYLLTDTDGFPLKPCNKYYRTVETIMRLRSQGKAV